jgi:hypothetical protein
MAWSLEATISRADRNLYGDVNPNDSESVEAHLEDYSITALISASDTSPPAASEPENFGLLSK